MTRPERPGGIPAIRSPDFVGREREVSALARALVDGPALVLVRGEAGVGKTRLLQEFLALPDGQRLRSLVAWCPPFAVPNTLGPVVDALRGATERVGGLRLSPLAGALRPLFPEWAGELPAPPEPLEDAGAARHRLFRAMAELLGALHVDVLVVEDAHWADFATLEFLLFLLAGAPRLHVVVTYRPEDIAPDSLLRRVSSTCRAGHAIDVGALDVEGTAELVSSMLGGEHVSAEFAGALHQETAGLPLVLEETVRLMNERADLVHRGTGWVRRRLEDLAVPPLVRDTVLERLAGLGSDTRAVLRAAAVLAEPVDDAVLGAVCGLPGDRFAAGLTTALGSGLLRETRRERVSFRHALAARAVYDAIPRPERRATHLRAALALESAVPQPVARLAHHFREAGHSARWVDYGERAADLALASGDEATATILLHDLLTRADLAAEAVARLVDRIPGLTIVGTNRCGDIVRTVRSALAGRDLCPETEGELRFMLAKLLGLLDEHVQSRPEFAAAVAHLEHDPAKSARAMLGLGRPRDPHTPAAEHLAWVYRAEELLAAMSAADRAVFRCRCAEVLLSLGQESGWDRVAEVLDIPPDQWTRDEATLAHLNLGEAAIRWGHYGTARKLIDEAFVLSDAELYPHGHEVVLGNIAYLDWLTGRWDGLAERVVALSANLNDAALAAALLHAAVGDHERAADRLGRIYADLRRRAVLECCPEPAGALARLHLAAGRVDDALAVTDDPVDILARKGIWLWATAPVPVRAEALFAAGRAAEAADLVAAFADGLGDLDAPAPQAALLLCRAIVLQGRGDRQRAAAGYGRAAEAWQGLPRPYDALLARERQADCLFAAGLTDDARPLLVEVHRGLSDLGAAGDAGRVAARLRGLGVDVRLRQWHGRRGYGDQLSPRELDVVRLVAGGLTNREIAERLVLSPKTVGHQVNRAMRKLRVTTRTALAVKAVEAGIVPDHGGSPLIVPGR